MNQKIKKQNRKASNKSEILIHFRRQKLSRKWHYKLQMKVKESERAILV